MSLISLCSGTPGYQLLSTACCFANPLMGNSPAVEGFHLAGLQSADFRRLTSYMFGTVLAILIVRNTIEIY